MFNLNTHIYNNSEEFGIEILSGLTSILFPQRYRIPSYSFFYRDTTAEEFKEKADLWNEINLLSTTSDYKIFKEYIMGATKKSLYEKYGLTRSGLQTIINDIVNRQAIG